MRRETMLKVVMIVVGLLFTAAVLPTIGGIRDPAHSDTGDTMQMAIYATLGVFLLIGARNPPAHRSLINFTAWSSFAHAIAMGSLGLEIPDMRSGFIGGSAVLVAIGIALLALRPTTSAPTSPRAPASESLPSAV